jgi:anti-sigma regulatory factor (Ser/Thr protein kinase)
LATLTLLVSEIVTNAVIHPDARPTDSIGFAARAYRGFVRVEVTDQGSGFTPTPRDPAQVGGGYGLYLLKQEARRWGVTQQDGITVWFEVGT